MHGLGLAFICSASGDHSVHALFVFICHTLSACLAHDDHDEHDSDDLHDEPISCKGPYRGTNDNPRSFELATYTSPNANPTSPYIPCSTWIATFCTHRRIANAAASPDRNYRGSNTKQTKRGRRVDEEMRRSRTRVLSVFQSFGQSSQIHRGHFRRTSETASATCQM